MERYRSGRPRSQGEGRSGETRRKRYDQGFLGPLSCLDPATAPVLDDFCYYPFYYPFYRIMRQRLLADRMVPERELNVDDARVVVIAPEENWGCRTVADGGTTTTPLPAWRFPQLGTVIGNSQGGDDGLLKGPVGAGPVPSRPVGAV